ncbi:MAG: hypothetical protein JWQ09_1666 [Segetibacter sp.]|nr:hypothetical protein [Segetibacter sp.]
MPHFALYLFLLYLNLKMRIQKLRITEKLLVTMIGQSSRRIPYTTHRIIPIIKDRNIPIERSSTFFSFIIFINWGKSEEDVKMPATVPITAIVFKYFEF